MNRLWQFLLVLLLTIVLLYIVRRFLARFGRWVWAVLTSSSFWKVVGGGVFLALLVGALFVPELQVQRAIVRSTVVNPEAKVTPVVVANLENEYRKTYLQALGGLLAIIALIYTYRRVVVAEQGHITDRYTKAIEQLGAMKSQDNPNVEVRLGAIYALERIAQDSPRDHWTIMEVLTAYVRQNAPKPAGVPTEEENKAPIAKGPATEIQAILTVLGRRRRDRGREQEGQCLDLMYCDLRVANFRGTHMEGANFFGAHMEGVSFLVAHAEGANFSGAHVEEARFDGAHVEGAFFYGAHVEGANFWGAHLKEARFDGAYVEGVIFDCANLEGVSFVGAHVEGTSFDEAYVEGADFRDAMGLTVEQIREAEGWEQAKFDEAFRRELEEA